MSKGFVLILMNKFIWHL